MDKDRLIELWDQLSDWQQSLVIKAIEYMIQQKGEENGTDTTEASA